MKLSMASSSLTYYLQEGVELKTALQALRDCGFSCVDLEISADMLMGDYEKDAIEMAELLTSTWQDRGMAPSASRALAAARAMAMGSVQPMAGISSSFRICT